MIWRDIKVRYKQTFLGAAWAVIQPVLTMLVFNFIFGTIAKFRPMASHIRSFRTLRFCRGGCLSRRSITPAVH